MDNNITICQICNKPIRLKQKAVPYHIGVINDKQLFRHQGCEPDIIPPKYRRLWTRNPKTQVVPNKKKKSRAQQKDDIRKQDID